MIDPNMLNHTLIMTHMYFHHSYIAPKTLSGLIASLLILGLFLVIIIMSVMTFIITIITNHICKYKVKFSLLYAVIINPILYFILGLLIYGFAGNFVALLLTMYIYAVKNKESNTHSQTPDSELSEGVKKNEEGSAFTWALIATIILYLLIVIPVFILLLKIFTVRILAYSLFLSSL